MPQNEDDKYHWEIEFWENRNNISPVEKVLEKIKKKDHVFYRHIMKQLDRLQKKPITILYKTGYLESIEGGLCELKITVPKKEFRVLGVLSNDTLLIPVLISLNAFHKKDNKIRRFEIKIALERKGQLLG